MTEAGRRFGSLISSPAAAGEAFFYLSSIAEREGRTDLALEGYTKLVGGRRRTAGARPRRAAAHEARRARRRRSACSTSTPPRSAPRRSTWNSPRPRCSRTPASRTRPSRCCSWRSSVIPIIPGVRYQIALIQDKAGLTRESVRNFESLLKDRPEDASLLNALGYSLADRNQKLPRAETADPQGAGGLARQSRPSSTASAGCASAAATFRARCRTWNAPIASSRMRRSPRTGASCCG